MTTDYKRMRQLIGSTTEWGNNDIVIGDGEVAVERAIDGSIKIKVGDGTSKFSALPYVSGTTAGIPPSVVTELAKYVLLSGGTLTGKITLPDITSAGFSVGPNDAITRKWAESNINAQYASNAEAAAGALNNKAISPATFAAGAIVAGGTALAAGKVVKTDANGKIDPSLIGAVNTGGVPNAGSVVKLNANGKIDPSMLAAGGMNFKGSIDPSTVAPTGHVAGDFYIANNSVNAAPSWVGIAGQAIKNGDALLWDGAKWDALASDQDLSAFVMLDGSKAMTGQLSLVGDPTADNHAARKKYVDDKITAAATAASGNYLALTGGTLTGKLTLSAAPTADLEASTKKYVDDEIALEVTRANTAYETKTNAAATYETKADAATTYLTQASATATYLSKTDAAAAYAPLSLVARVTALETLLALLTKTSGGYKVTGTIEATGDITAFKP